MITAIRCATPALNRSPQARPVRKGPRPGPGARILASRKLGLADVELATAKWVDGFNNQRLHTAIGDIPPHEHETNHYAQHQPQPAAGVNAQSLHRSRSGSPPTST
ncbi:hypothetical protein GCM10010250_65990 [Streptomyces althioticus]|nr:hypothetical protein GCM10010250_65990 [Streptomyces althioticus]